MTCPKGTFPYFRIAISAVKSVRYLSVRSLITQRSVVQIHPPQPNQINNFETPCRSAEQICAETCLGLDRCRLRSAHIAGGSESRRRNPMEYQNVSRLSRRTFLFAGFVAAV